MWSYTRVMLTPILPDFAARWPLDAGILHLARREDYCRSLGPGQRTVLWVQGCCFRCPGCVAAETLSFRGGSAIAVNKLTEELLALDGIDGITISGGEPFMQAAALVALIDGLREKRDLSCMSYTGFTLEELHERNDPDEQALLEKLDLLVDGRFIREQQDSLLWRGSRNQRIHFLSDRHRSWRNKVEGRRILLEITVDEDGSFGWAGIPPRGFRRGLEMALKQRGLSLEQEGADR